MPDIPNENTFRRALEQGVNLFLGAGFSVLADDRKGRPMPTGSDLKAELVAEFALRDVDGLDLSQIATILQSDQRAEFDQFVRRRFRVDRFDERYECLDRLNVKTIFTTNVDDLVHQIYAESSTHYASDLDIKGPVFNDRAAIDVVSLHGSVLDENRPLLFGSLDIASAFSSDPERWYFLITRLRYHPTLFWGYGFNDAGTLASLNPKPGRGRPQQDKWVVLHPSLRADTRVRYFEALGLQPFYADTSEMLDYLLQVPIEAGGLVVAEERARTRDLFPTEAVPDVGTVPVRPILDFYLGAQPSWHDIFSGQIHRTNHFNTARDAINSGQHTIAIGLPGCGKTTLMMQLAAEVPFGGHKLVADYVSEEKGRLIANRLRGERALVFIDNVADSISAFDILSRQANIQVVGFERDYYYEIVSHKVNLGSTKVVDVTELTPGDIQQIQTRIPQRIKSENPGVPTMPEGIPPSIFEIIQHSVSRPKLQERYHAVLEELRKVDWRLLDLLLMCCYVHWCRTPVTLDMILAYFDEDVADYDEICQLLDRLGSMITDYHGDYADTPQDHFSPRSTLFANAVIYQASSSALKSMVIRFHENLRPYHICRYDVFRRRAFDADLMERAFQVWQEGKLFYESVCASDASPYFLQQGALYLSRKRRHTEAFGWIDEAVTRSNYRIPSIRHSHAIILFRANIGQPETDETVNRTLRMSMDILSECYAYDRRKIYHALTFADQAIQYYDKYGNDEATEYLLTARKWLGDELRRAPWLRNAARLLRQVEAVLARRRGT
jgi:hypothetical protein